MALEDTMCDKDATLSDQHGKIRSFSDPSVFLNISEFTDQTACDCISVKSTIVEIAEAYEEMKQMSMMLLRADEDETIATARIASEMSALKETAARIGDELKFIEDERERLTFKAASGDNRCPLPELLDAGIGYYNPTWIKLYNRNSCESTYN